MKISTNKKFLEAAQNCSDEYHKELLDEEGIESVSDWKETAFFMAGADWCKDKVWEFIRTHLVPYTGFDSTEVKECFSRFMNE